MTHYTQRSADSLDVVIPSPLFESSAAGDFCSRLAGEILHDPQASRASAMRIDLSRVESMDSVGATALARISQATGSKAAVAFLNPQPGVRSVLSLLRMDGLVAEG